MKIEEYSKLALRTANKENAIVHACFGIAGEAGEIVDSVKKAIFHNKPLDREALIAEIGDEMWYLNLLVNALDTTWDRVLEVNIKKLEARYPDLRFDADRANNRDTAAEALAMAADSILKAADATK